MDFYPQNRFKKIFKKKKKKKNNNFCLNEKHIHPRHTLTLALSLEPSGLEKEMVYCPCDRPKNLEIYGRLFNYLFFLTIF